MHQCPQGTRVRHYPVIRSKMLNLMPYLTIPYRTSVWVTYRGTQGRETMAAPYYRVVLTPRYRTAVPYLVRRRTSYRTDNTKKRQNLHYFRKILLEYRKNAEIVLQNAGKSLVFCPRLNQLLKENLSEKNHVKGSPYGEVRLSVQQPY